MNNNLTISNVKVGELFVDYYGRLCEKLSEKEVKIVSLSYQKPTNPIREINKNFTILAIIEP